MRGHVFDGDRGFLRKGCALVGRGIAPCRDSCANLHMRALQLRVGVGLRHRGRKCLALGGEGWHFACTLAMAWPRSLPIRHASTAGDIETRRSRLARRMRSTSFIFGAARCGATANIDASYTGRMPSPPSPPFPAMTCARVAHHNPIGLMRVSGLMLPTSPAQFCPHPPRSGQNQPQVGRYQNLAWGQPNLDEAFTAKSGNSNPTRAATSFDANPQFDRNMPRLGRNQPQRRALCGGDVRPDLARVFSCDGLHMLSRETWPVGVRQRVHAFCVVGADVLRMRLAASVFDACWSALIAGSVPRASVAGVFRARIRAMRLSIPTQSQPRPAESSSNPMVR